MHWIEGIIMIGAGFILWLIATERFPVDPLKRDALMMRMPLSKNKTVLRGAAIFLWLFGMAAVAGLIK